jgi:ankyrin repeat protein
MILLCAVSEDRVAIAEQLLRRPELDINAADDIQNTALHIAAERGHTGMIELLLQRPEIEINLKNRLGWTPLSKAAFADHVEVVRRLLGRPELEPNLVDRDRQTPLFHAASTGKLEVVRLLLADPRTNAAISNRPAGQTALDMAAALDFTAVAELIREHAGSADELSPRDSYVDRSIEPPPVTIIRPPKR